MIGFDEDSSLMKDWQKFQDFQLISNQRFNNSKLSTRI